MADLSLIKSTDRVIEVMHPGTGEPIGIRVTLVSVEDETLSKVKRNITNRSLELRQRGKHFKADELEDNKQTVLWSAMKGWEWYNPTGKSGDESFDADAMPNVGGEVPEFNQRNVKSMLGLTWFSNQIEEAVDDTKAFFLISKPI